jgi:hypothetical protein
MFIFEIESNNANEAFFNLNLHDTIDMIFDTILDHDGN